MENHLERMQADVDVMEGMFSNPTEDETSVSTDEAQNLPTDTLDNMIDDGSVEEEVEGGEESRKPKRVNWKSRYSKYKAKTDATIFELRQENSNFISQIQLLSRQVDALRVSTEDTTSFNDRFTDVDKEIFGEEALSSLEAATNAAVEPLKRQLAEEKEWRAKQLEMQRIRSKQEANTYFLTALADAVPEYMEIDNDPAFIGWMDQPDSTSGIPRVKLFKQAEQAGDVFRVADFMKEFQEASKPVDHLKDKVSPITTSATSPTKDTDTSFTMDEVQGFYDDVLRGVYRKNEKGRLEMDNRINKAFAERRVH